MTLRVAKIRRNAALIAAIAALGWVIALTEADANGEIERTPSSDGAQLYLISPENGAKVQPPVTVRFGLKGMGVAPAGVAHPGTGHHHLLIDTDVPDLTQPIPSDEKHRHFGGGQTEVTLELAPGDHSLQLLFADHRHVPHEPPLLSERITIHVR
ncbi:MAG: DUF4399 domain-containing protein [Myxococcota bacterium]